VHKSIDNFVKQSSARPVKLTPDQIKGELDLWHEVCEEKAPRDEDGEKFIDFKKEFTPNGLLSSFFLKAIEGESVDLKALFALILSVNEITLMIACLEKQFGETSLLTLNGNLIDIKIAENNGHSIGYLFAYI
jgi:hypothetical protein